MLKDLSTFTILIDIGRVTFGKALCDVRAFLRQSTCGTFLLLQFLELVEKGISNNARSHIMKLFSGSHHHSSSTAQGSDQMRKIDFDLHA
ncbi:hypothetical protein EPI10_031090 [Gossypium australe]|uniref:Uncharacterized protein n=1 Tax=Gossypium australe TaxID=47621 RepID=A0A5B6X2E6_9ROSI|nr:hypothetical protein EPI10_031090 [Gossypium australe]